jgi:short-subunit dehydrogenase
MANTDLKRRFGPTAMITAASDGMGRACAKALALQGFDLPMVAIREPALQALSKELVARHGLTVLGLIMRGMRAPAKG